MSRTGASTSRTSTSRSKNRDRKPAAKNTARPKSAVRAGKPRPVKSVPKPKTMRHEIRKRESGAAVSRHSASPSVRREKPATPIPPSTAPLKPADDTRMMKKATINKPPKSVAEEKEKRKAAPADSPKAKAAPPPKEVKSKAPKVASSPVPPDTTAKPATSRRKRGEGSGSEPRAKAGRPPRSKSFGFNDELIQDFVADADAVSEELDDELALDPMELPLELLDPELVEVPRPSPQPKPKPVTSRRQQSCASCGNTFAWLSVDQLCFNCLKKKLAQRKREDETYPGFTGEAEEEEDVS